MIFFEAITTLNFDFEKKRWKAEIVPPGMQKICTHKFRVKSKLENSESNLLLDL